MVRKLFGKIGAAAKRLFGHAKVGYSKARDIAGKVDRAIRIAQEVLPMAEQKYGSLFERGATLLADAQKRGQDVARLIDEADPRKLKAMVEEVAKRQEARRSPAAAEQESPRMVERTAPTLPTS